MPANEHHCDAPKNTSRDMHGQAVTWCGADANGVLWAGNDEYCNTVDFCPFCGRPGPPMPDPSKFRYGYKFAKEPT